MVVKTGNYCQKKPKHFNQNGKIAGAGSRKSRFSFRRVVAILILPSQEHYHIIFLYFFCYFYVLSYLAFKLPGDSFKKGRLFGTFMFMKELLDLLSDQTVIVTDKDTISELFNSLPSHGDTLVGSFSLPSHFSMLTSRSLCINGKELYFVDRDEVDYEFNWKISKRRV